MAVISDVHGNAFALEAVLREVEASAPDAVINLGDQVEGAADPGRAARMQAELRALEVRGNNEEKLWRGGRRSAESQAFGVWLSGQVPSTRLEALAGLPPSVRLGGIYACHGTPESAWDSLLWVWQPDPDGGEGFYRSRLPLELGQMVAPLNAGVVVCGHTHRPGATHVNDTLVVNAGAVSDQVDGDPRARWTLLERRAGRWSVDFRAVKYDIDAAVAWAYAHSPYGKYEEALLRSGRLDGRGV